MKSKIVEIVKRISGNNYLYLEDPIVVKKTPHSIPVNLWAISVSPDNEIYLMDVDGGYKLEETDRNYQLVLATLFQRVSMIDKHIKTA